MIQLPSNKGPPLNTILLGIKPSIKWVLVDILYFSYNTFCDTQLKQNSKKGEFTWKVCWYNKACHWPTRHFLAQSEYTTSELGVIFFRVFSITGFQKACISQGIIFCIIGADHNRQSHFKRFEVCHNDHVALLLTSREVRSTKLFIKLSAIFTIPHWHQKVDI